MQINVTNRIKISDTLYNKNFKTLFQNLFVVLWQKCHSYNEGKKVKTFQRIIRIIICHCTLFFSEANINDCQVQDKQTISKNKTIQLIMKKDTHMTFQVISKTFSHIFIGFIFSTKTVQSQAFHSQSFCKNKRTYKSEIKEIIFLKTKTKC